MIFEWNVCKQTSQSLDKKKVTTIQVEKLFCNKTDLHERWEFSHFCSSFVLKKTISVALKSPIFKSRLEILSNW